MVAEWSLRLGAFSYAVSGYYYGASIGRYTSIGETVQVGRGSHPVSFASTSPAFYERHTEVFQLAFPEASDYQINAPYRSSKPTVIGNDVYIGHGAFLMQGITVGDGAVIGAHSVVTKDVPPYSVVAGSPAVVRKMRFTDSIIERMQAVKWWQYAFWDLSGIPVSDPTGFLDFVERRRDEGLQPYKPGIVSIKSMIGD
jgi:acetyltransferase-like isoleucine patch superfamily enzyme